MPASPIPGCSRAGCAKVRPLLHFESVDLLLLLRRPMDIDKITSAKPRRDIINSSQVVFESPWQTPQSATPYTDH